MAFTVDRLIVGIFYALVDDLRCGAWRLGLMSVNSGDVVKMMWSFFHQLIISSVNETTHAHTPLSPTGL